jgi:hypothetical protein
MVGGEVSRGETNEDGQLGNQKSDGKYWAFKILFVPV